MFWPENEDGFDLDALAVPGVGEDDPAVGVGGQEHAEQLAQQLLIKPTTRNDYVRQAVRYK